MDLPIGSHQPASVIGRDNGVEDAVLAFNFLEHPGNDKDPVLGSDRLQPGDKGTIDVFGVRQELILSRP